MTGRNQLCGSSCSLRADFAFCIYNEEKDSSHTIKLSKTTQTDSSAENKVFLYLPTFQDEKTIISNLS